MDNLSALINQNQKLLTTSAFVVLTVLMSLTVAQTVLFFVENLSQSETTQSTAARIQQPRANLDTSQIRNLFGNFQAEAAPVQQNVPETSLNLELQGVFTADNPKGSTAIIAQRGQSGQLFRVGDRLPGNATLEAVYENHILIKRGARTEKLAFDDPFVGQGFSASTSSNSNSRPAGNQVVLNPDGTATTNAQRNISRLDNVRERIANRSANISSQRTAAPDLRTAISDFQNRLADDPDTVLTELGVSASGDGFKIGGQVPQAMLRQVGLQEGDVVISVNGQSASSVAGNQALMNQVMESERARVEVQRGQRRFVVTVPIPKS